jgi:uncharacterized membrane protein
MIATNKKTLNHFFEKYTTLSYWDIISIIVLSFLTAISSIVLFDFDKNYNTPLINTMIIKGVSTLALIIFGIFIYNEKYKYGQLFGFLLIIIGIYLVTQK